MLETCATLITVSCKSALRNRLIDKSSLFSLVVNNSYPSLGSKRRFRVSRRNKTYDDMVLKVFFFPLCSLLLTNQVFNSSRCVFIYRRRRASSTPEPTGRVYPLVVRSRHRAASGEHRSTWAELLHSYGRPEWRQVQRQLIRGQNLKHDFSNHVFSFFFYQLSVLQIHFTCLDSNYIPYRERNISFQGVILWQL